MKNKLHFILIGIVILGFILRFFMLGQNPPGLNWDEASIGYNAYSILETGKDEYGNFLPLDFRSFDDYKPPLYVYLTVPAVAVFGLNEFSVRLPATFLGTLAIVVFYFLIKELIGKRKEQEMVSLIGAFLLAVSPWHLQFSRTAYEGNVGLFFIMLGSLFFFLGLKRYGYIFLSTIAFALAMYSYHSFRVVVPLTILVLLILFFKEILKFKKIIILNLVIMSILILPIFSSLFIPKGSTARLSMVTIFRESDALKENLQQLEIDKNNNNYVGMVINNRRIFFLREIVKGYFDHFSPNYLYLLGAGSFHHHAKDMGMMYLWELPFLFIGFIFTLRQRERRYIFMLAFLLIAPLPAAITTGTPHGVRSIAMIPSLLFFTAFGIYYFIALASQWRRVGKIVLSFFLITVLVGFIYYLNQYYVTTPRVYGYFWQSGNKEAIQKAKELENDYDEIVFSYQYDQPYIYYLFYNSYDPQMYQNNWSHREMEVERFSRKIGKYSFQNININELNSGKKILLIATPNEAPDNLNSIYTVYFPDGRIAYEFIEL